MEIINTIIGLGASVMMPIIFFVVGLIFRMGIGKSFKAGMTVGVGFVGVNMVINLLLDNLGPASKAMVNRLGLHQLSPGTRLASNMAPTTGRTTDGRVLAIGSPARSPFARPSATAGISSSAYNSRPLPDVQMNPSPTRPA